MRFGLILLFVASLCGSLLAQENGVSDVFTMVNTPSNGGRITIVQDAKLKQLVLSHIQSNSKIETMEGFRIQIYSGSSKKAKGEAMAAKAKMLSLYPDIPVYLEYNAPFWRVRVGDFRSKNESMELFSRIKSSFQDSYPVKDLQINYARIAEPLSDVVIPDPAAVK